MKLPSVIHSKLKIFAIETASYSYFLLFSFALYSLSKQLQRSLFFLFQHSPIPQVIKVKFQARASSTMADEDSYYGKDASLQFAMNVNSKQTDNILVYLYQRLHL